MYDILGHLQLGFITAVSFNSLLYCFIGCLLGTLIGVLPGIGPGATIAMLLPITFGLDPTTAVIMLAGIFYGTQYGSSTTAILLNIPGEATSVVTAIDGYQMARQGRAGLALSASAIGSFFAGTVATLVIALLAPALAAMALRFGAPEYFALMVLGLIVSMVLASGSAIKALAMICLGLLLSLIGTDVTTGTSRLTFGNYELADGLDIVAVAIGLFGLGEIILNLSDLDGRQAASGRSISSLWPTRKDLRQMFGPILRGTGIGSALGILPGGGALLSSFVAYAVEKKISRQPERFGKGALEGVAAPEAANNAGVQTSFIPMLTLGLPSNVVIALMMGALIIHGIQPGPGMMSEQPRLFWGLIVSMWVGNLILVVLNLPLIGIWVRLLTIPYRYLFPAIMVFCCIGAYTISNSVFDIYVMIAFGLVGYVFKRLDCEPAPFILGFVLGPMLEEYLRRAMLLSRGDPMIFLTRPISAVLLGLAAIAILMLVIPAVRAGREEALVED
ncbi:MAG: tripartite tricarboxylate transporter permease [Hyphomicrobiales bacterium]|jgi:TctA family transporter|nr:tripartite tricarboxylate transporter permease [Hyphomicrobiales bacterium]